MAIEKIRQYLKPHTEKGIAIAFSGGVDSSFLLAVLAEMKTEHDFPIVALTMHSVFQKPEELNEARQTASKNGIPIQVFSFNPLSVDEVKNNPPDRCYWCKKNIFARFTDYAKNNGYHLVIDGTNADDLDVYRPGRKALKEFGVASPLAELGITKPEIRRMVDGMGLECASRPSAPCLATRFEYGTILTEDNIKRVAQGEALLHSLFYDAQNIRLRVHGSIARIEVPPEYFRTIAEHANQITAGLKNLGFTYITLDLEGFRSGSMDLNLEEDNGENL